MSLRSMVSLLQSDHQEIFELLAAFTSNVFHKTHDQSLNNYK